MQWPYYICASFDLSVIFDIVSTKEDSENHGYGLKNIKKTVEKYDGYIEDDHANNTFSVDIILFVKPELDNE